MTILHHIKTVAIRKIDGIIPKNLLQNVEIYKNYVNIALKISNKH